MEEGHRIRDPEQTRAAVVDAAERLFSDRGFAATSMRDISAASGVSHPLIHHHFGSKEALYAAVKRRVGGGYGRAFPRGARGANRPVNGRGGNGRVMAVPSGNPVLVRVRGWARLEGDVQVWPGEP